MSVPMTTSPFLAGPGRRSPHRRLWLAVALIVLSLEAGPSAAADLRLPEVDGPATAARSLAADPDWPGLARDMAFFLSYQAITVGVIYFLPESVSNWTSDDKDTRASKWLDNIQEPRWDKDDWFVNYVAHPYVGAIYYTRARERGFSKGGSFVFSAVASASYEFGVEALFEHPSYQDLIVTPVAGALLGAFVFEPIRTRLKFKADRRWYEDVTLFATDPLGALNGALERLLGIKSELRVAPRAPTAIGTDGHTTGVSIELRVPLR
jgi:hypothetical protein